MAYQHLPAPPVWLDDNDGFHDVRIMHSAGGVHWRYVGGDRSAFMSRGPSGGAAVFSVDASPDDRDPRTWRESMVAAVRGLVIDDNQTMTMFACEYSSSRVDAFLKRLKERLRTDGARLREGSAQPNSDGVPDGSFVRLTMRRDGWSSIGPVSSKWTQPGSFTTHPLVFEGTRLLLNAQTSNVSLATVCLSHLTGWPTQTVAANREVRSVRASRCLGAARRPPSHWTTASLCKATSSATRWPGPPPTLRLPTLPRCPVTSYAFISSSGALESSASASTLRSPLQTAVH